MGVYYQISPFATKRLDLFFSKVIKLFIISMKLFIFKIHMKNNIIIDFCDKSAMKAKTSQKFWLQLFYSVMI